VSALTKIFVVLLVVMSLLLSAALIVFVNHQENYKIAADKADAKYKTTEQEKRAALGNLSTAQTDNRLMVQAKDDQIVAARNDVQTAQATISQRDTQIAELQQNLATANGTANGTAQALQVAQSHIQTQDKHFTDLRNSYDKLQLASTESDRSVADLTFQVSVLTKNNRVAGEQVAQLQQQNAQLQDVVSKYNLSPAGANKQGPINMTPNVNINGYVKAIMDINKVQYATISIGQAEQVTKGMQFKVIDPAHQEFLGYLTIVQVDPHTATGSLKGPAIGQVHQGTEVRTQL